jgi:hypothetical protein
MGPASSACGYATVYFADEDLAGALPAMAQAGSCALVMEDRESLGVPAASPVRHESGRRLRAGIDDIDRCRSDPVTSSLCWTPADMLKSIPLLPRSGRTRLREADGQIAPPMPLTAVGLRSEVNCRKGTERIPWPSGDTSPE